MSGQHAKVSMTEGALLPILVRVALPITFANLFQASYDIINAFWLGRLGQDAIAAVTASGPLFFVLISLGSGLSTAGAVLIAQNAGAKRYDALDHVAAQTLLMVAVMALVFTLFGAATTGPSLRLIGVEPEIADLAADYLLIRYLGMVPMFVFMAVQAMLQSVGEVRFAMRVQLASLVLNAALDPVLIFGLGPLAPMGVSGAAWATVIAQALALAVVLQHMLTGRSVLHLRVRHFRPDLAHIRLALNLGLPASVEQATRTFSSLLLMSLAAGFGTIGLASYGVGTRLLFFWFTPIVGLGIATATVVGQNIGAGLTERADQAARIAAKLGFVALTVVGLVHLPFAGLIMETLAPGEGEVIENATVFAYIYLPFLGINAVNQVLLGTFRGAGSTRQSMALSLIQQWAFQLPIAWGLALATPLGLIGIWLCYPVGNAATLILGLLWFRFGAWRRQLVLGPAPG